MRYTKTDFLAANNQQLSRIMEGMVRNQPHTAAPSEPYQGKTPSRPGTITTYEELAAYFAKMGVFGEGAFTSVILAASKEPRLAIYHPDEKVTENFSVQTSNDSRLAMKTGIPNAAAAGIPSEPRQSFAGRYSYDKNLYSSDYLKSAARSTLYGISNKVRELFARIRGVYQSSLGQIKKTAIYRGKSSSDSEKGNSPLSRYRKAINPYLSANRISGLRLEERLA